MNRTEPGRGDRVRCSCGATGRYVRDGLALFVSAQDSDLGMDCINPDQPHSPSLPVPSDDAVDGAWVALTYRNPDVAGRRPS